MNSTKNTRETREYNPLSQVIEKLQKRGVHLCHVKNGQIQEAHGRHTIDEIESKGGEKIITIGVIKLGEFLQRFLEEKKKRKEVGGHISFATKNDTITIYGGPRTKSIIQETPELSDMSVLNDDVEDQREDTRDRVRETIS